MAVILEYFNYYVQGFCYNRELYKTPVCFLIAKNAKNFARIATLQWVFLKSVHAHSIICLSLMMTYSFISQLVSQYISRKFNTK